MSGEDHAWAETRRRVAQRLRAQLIFWAHFVVFVLAGSAASWRPSLLALWFFIIVAHGLIAYNVWGRLVDRATRREMTRRGLAPEKAKRNDAKPYTARLSDDGELEYEDEAEPQIASARKQKNTN